MAATPLCGATARSPPSSTPITGHFVLVDSFETPQGGDLDARVVDHQLETPAEVEALVSDYLPRATRYAGPLSR